MKELKLDIEQEEHLKILEDLRKNNKKEIVIIEVQIEMGAVMLEKAKKKDEITNKDKKEDEPVGTEAVAIQMKIDAFNAQRVEMYDGLDFINKKIDEVSKGTKD